MTLTLKMPVGGNALPPPIARPIDWHGFFVDANSHDATTLEAMFDQTAAYGLTSVVFANGDTTKLDTLLGVCDSYGVRASCGPRTEVDTFFWNPGTMPSLQDTIDFLEPKLEILAAHESLVRWYPLDEPFLNNTGGITPTDYMDRAARLCEAYHTINTGHPVTPLFIGLDRMAVGIPACDPDELFIDVYPYGMIDSGGGVPAGAPYEAEPILRSFGLSMTAREYIEAAKALAPGLPLVIVMQAHNFFGPPADDAIWELWGNRKPTSIEMQDQHDLAAEEGATEIYWFRWESNLAPEDGEMYGLEDDPTLLAAVIAISQGGDVGSGGGGGGGGGGGSIGVPQPTIPYDTGVNAVKTWWDAHILNPVVSASAEIVSPTTRYTLTSGQSIQDAYDDLVANFPQGGTIILGDGTYTDWPDIFGYQFSDLGHVHIKAAHVGMVTVMIPTRPIVSAHPWCTRYHDEEPDYPGWTFTQGISSGVAANATENSVNARTLVTTARVQDVYFRGIIFDANGGDRRFDLMAAKGVMFDECQFINGVGSLAAGVHTGPICGRVCLDHVYYRNCTFEGTWKQATYLDGVFGWAAINCTVGDDIRNEAYLLLCNDDFTRDYNNSGTYSVSEKRMAQFAVVHGGDFGDIAYPFQATGRDLLMTNVTLQSPVDTAMWVETKASHRGTLDTFGNIHIRNVDIPNGAVRCLIHTKNVDFDEPTRPEPIFENYSVTNVDANYGDDIESEGSFG